MRFCLALAWLGLCVVNVAVAEEASVEGGAAISADSTRSTDPPDSTLVRTGSGWAWWNWPPIASAIAIAPLDGPQDILERSEIIADRIDALVAEAARLDTVASLWHARHIAMTAQLEVLEDLADIQLGGDLEFQQRTESVREDLLQTAAQIAVFARSDSALVGELTRLRAMSAAYLHRAEELRQQEENPR